MVKGKEFDEAMWRVTCQDKRTAKDQQELQEMRVELCPLLDIQKGGRLLDYIVKHVWDGKGDKFEEAFKSAGIDCIPLTRPSFDATLVLFGPSKRVFSIQRTLSLQSTLLAMATEIERDFISLKETALVSDTFFLPPEPLLDHVIC